MARRRLESTIPTKRAPVPRTLSWRREHVAQSCRGHHLEFAPRLQVFPTNTSVLGVFSTPGACASYSSFWSALAPFQGTKRHQKAPKGTKEKPAMKITKVKHHAHIRFRVNEPDGPDGKRHVGSSPLVKASHAGRRCGSSRIRSTRSDVIGGRGGASGSRLRQNRRVQRAVADGRFGNFLEHTPDGLIEWNG